MAVVYKARCHRLNRLVAIKILKDEYSQDEEFRRRFHAEGQAVAMLSHPNIVAVYDVSTSNDADYIVMELIDGITLKQYMEKKGVLNWKETLHFAMQIGKALEHAHSRGIVHRDIKPHNVMVLKNGSVKVADFGIARVMSKSNTLTKEALGSVHYISPEQAKGGRVDNRSDIYSLGVVMYEMMAGRPPYDGESPVAVAIQHINGGAPMPSTLNPNIPGGLEQIIMKAMALESSGRYNTATAMLYDMDEFRKNPAMLFDYGGGDSDDFTMIRSIPLTAEEPKQPVRTTAQRVAAGNGAKSTPRQSQNPRRRPSQQQKRRREEEEAGSNRVAAIAIVACSVVAVVAILIFLLTLINGGLSNQKKQLVLVPNLVGEYYSEIKPSDYENFEIVLIKSEYNGDFKEDQIIEQKPLSGDMVEKGTKISVVVSLGAVPETEAETMDDLYKVEQSVAETFLQNKGYDPLVREEYSADVDAGYVTRTDPKQGDKLKPGQTVTIWISLGPETIKNKVPHVVGQDIDMALKLLSNSGFHNVTPKEVESYEDEGTVISQSVKGNAEKVDVETEIILEVSKGPQETTVPPTETDPEPTVVYVEKQMMIALPTDRKEAYELCLKQGDENVLDPLMIEDVTQTELEVVLVGTGVARYDIYINNEFYDKIYVDFTETE